VGPRGWRLRPITKIVSARRAVSRRGGSLRARSAGSSGRPGRTVIALRPGASGSFGRGEARVRLGRCVARVPPPRGPIGPQTAHDTAPALTMAPGSPECSREGGHAAAGSLQCSRLWESIQSGQLRTNSRRTEPHATAMCLRPKDQRAGGATGRASHRAIGCGPADRRACLPSRSTARRVAT
jgi:hypothetical protein